MSLELPKKHKPISAISWFSTQKFVLRNDLAPGDSDDLDPDCALIILLFHHVASLMHTHILFALALHPEQRSDVLWAVPSATLPLPSPLSCPYSFIFLFVTITHLEQTFPYYPLSLKARIFSRRTVMTTVLGIFLIGFNYTALVPWEDPKCSFINIVSFGFGKAFYY